MKESVVQFFERLTSLNEGDREIIEQCFVRAEYGAKQKVLYQGDVCSSINYIVSGLVRYAFIDNDGNDVCTSFRQENEFITDYESFLRNKPSDYFIECIEPTVCLKLDRFGLNRLYTEVESGNLIGRRIAEELFLESQDRLFSFYNDSAEDRYKEFVENHGDLVNRIPQVFIASFIGVKPESLSRIKRRQLST